MPARAASLLAGIISPHDLAMAVNIVIFIEDGTLAESNPFNLEGPFQLFVKL